MCVHARVKQAHRETIAARKAARAAERLKHRPARAWIRSYSEAATSQCSALAPISRSSEARRESPSRQLQAGSARGGLAGVSPVTPLCDARSAYCAATVKLNTPLEMCESSPAVCQLTVYCPGASLPL